MDSFFYRGTVGFPMKETALYSTDKTSVELISYGAQVVEIYSVEEK